MYSGTYKSRMWNKVVEPEAIADANTTQWARTRRWVFRPTIERGREREWIEVKNKRKGFQLRLAYISNDSENKMHTSWCNVALDLDCLPDTLLHANCWYTFGSLDISRKNNFWANFVLFVRCRCLCVCVCSFFILISVHSTLFYIYTRFKAHFFVFYLDPSLVCLYCVRQIENCNVIELRKRISSYGCNVILEVGLWSHTLFIQSPIFYIHFFSHFSLFIHHGPSLFFFFMFGFILYVVGECETIATTFGILFMYVCIFFGE